MILSYDRVDSNGVSQGTVTIEFDTVLRATYSTAAEVTSHPVEKGAPANDHVKVGPDKVSFDAMVSNTPLSVPTTQMRGVSGSTRTENVSVTTSQWIAPGVVQKVTKEIAIRCLRFDGEFDRVIDVHDELRNIQATAQLVIAQTSDKPGGLLDYEDMVIQNLSAAHTAEDGSSQTFTFDLVKLRIVETRKVNAPDPTKTRTQRGKKGKTEVTAAEKPGLESIAHKLAEKAAALF